MRKKYGLFDVSHMGEIFLEGPGALAGGRVLFTNDIPALKPGEAMYTVACREDGGIIDDCIVYRWLIPDVLIVIVNAANIEKDFAHFHDQAHLYCAVRNHSDEYGLLALQGPG